MKLDIQLFAVSKSTTFSESNLDVVHNTSSLTITIYFSANNTSTWFSSETLYCTCNGVTQSAKVAHPKGGSTTKSFTFNNIQHNADGTKTVSWAWNCNTGTSVLGNVSASGTRKLADLHKPPLINSYSITETNQDLINAGVSNDMFVANLSKKSVNISYELYDNATLTRATAFNHITPYSNTTLPILIDFTQNPLVLQASKETSILGVPFLVRVEDSLNGLRYFTNKYGNFTESPSTGEYRDFYNYIPYIPVSFTSTTKARRVGQLSGQVALDIEGIYFNNNVGNVSQGNVYAETEDTEFLDDKNYYMYDSGNYLLLEEGVDYQIGDDIETYFTTVYDATGSYKPTIKYKYWKYEDTEPSTYDNVVSASDINVSNGTFSVSSLEIGSTTETDPNFFDPEYAYRIKVYVEDNFTNSESNELSITIGEATWTEYKDRVDFKKITVQGNDVLMPYVLFETDSKILDNYTLSDSAVNYKYLEIYYYWEDNPSWGVKMAKVDEPNGKAVLLDFVTDNNGYIYISREIANINGTSITKSGVVRWRIATGGGNSTRTANDNDMVIYKVIGYK